MNERPKFAVLVQGGLFLGSLWDRLFGILSHAFEGYLEDPFHAGQ